MRRESLLSQMLITSTPLPLPTHTAHSLTAHNLTAKQTQRWIREFLARRRTLPAYRLVGEGIVRAWQADEFENGWVAQRDSRAQGLVPSLRPQQVAHPAADNGARDVACVGAVCEGGEDVVERGETQERGKAGEFGIFDLIHWSVGELDAVANVHENCRFAKKGKGIGVYHGVHEAEEIGVLALIGGGNVGDVKR